MGLAPIFFDFTKILKESLFRSKLRNCGLIHVLLSFGSFVSCVTMSILSLDLTTRITLRARVKAVVRDAADFLDDLCRDDPVSVWLVGSRAGSVNPAYPERGGKTHEMSDWDFVLAEVNAEDV